MAKTTDAWQALVLKTMSTEELRRESENPENTDAERRAMRAELQRRAR